MGCDIHLILEIKLKKDKVWNEFYTEKGNVWKRANIFGHDGVWGDRIYGMFAVLADVRNYSNREHLPLRGFPEDANDYTKRSYYLKVIDKKPEELTDYEIENNYCSRENAERWLKNGYSKNVTLFEQEYITNPDWHSPNWCTTQEMEECVNKIFKEEDGSYKGDYIEWLALLGTMKGYELSGEYECRAVFWFDN